MRYIQASRHLRSSDQILAPDPLWRPNFRALVPARSLVRHSSLWGAEKHQAFKERDTPGALGLKWVFVLWIKSVKLRPKGGPGLAGPGWSAHIPGLQESDLPLQPHTVSYTDVLGGDTADNQSFVWVLKGRTWTTARPEAFFAATASRHQYSNLTSLLWLECCYFFSPLAPPRQQGWGGRGRNRWSPGLN